MAIRHYAGIGSISSGTLCTEDLLSVFASELEWFVRKNKGCRGIDLPGKRKLIRTAERASPKSEDASYILDELVDALNEFAPPYTYFGAHGGDGADFGFWPSVEDDLPRFPAGDEFPKGFRGDCVLINDHGNMSCGWVNGRGEFVEYWSCV